MKFIDVAEAKEVYRKGGNVTKFLRNKFKSETNTSEIIEIAYDLQTGSYIEEFKADPAEHEFYADDLSKILNDNLMCGDTLVDVGTGETTIFTLVLNRLDVKLAKILAFDISWSRLSVGMEFHRENRKFKYPLTTFVADMKEIPLPNKSVDVITSSHGLEPNGADLEKLLLEMFRVAKKKLVLFEPSYELNSDEGRARMDSLGYIKDIEGVVSKLGGAVLSITRVFEKNPLNPTFCFIIEPPTQNAKDSEALTFCVPGTNFKLETNEQYMFSKETGLVFPIIDGIAILKTSSALLATAMC